MERKEIIAYAKEAVRKLKQEHQGLFFTVQRSKGKVIVVQRKGGFANGEILARATSHCRKGEVFNEYIGKYIATKRLLDEPIEEMFFNLPQPTEIEIGSLLRRADKGISVYAPHGLSVKAQLFETVNVTGRNYRIMEGEIYTILDDTGYVEEHDWDAVAPSSPAVLDCYDRQKDDCDMRCQGMTNCIRANWIKGLQEKPSKKDMKNYIKELKQEAKDWRKVAKEMEADGTLDKLLEDLMRVKKNSQRK